MPVDPHSALHEAMARDLAKLFPRPPGPPDPPGNVSMHTGRPYPLTSAEKSIAMSLASEYERGAEDVRAAIARIRAAMKKHAPTWTGLDTDDGLARGHERANSLCSCSLCQAVSRHRRALTAWSEATPKGDGTVVRMRRGATLR